MVINKIIKQQDIFIVANHIEGRDQDILLTDDYCGFDIRVGDKRVLKYIESDGFINILTLDELLKYKEEIIDINEDTPCIKLSNFCGDLSIIVVDEDKVEYDDLDTSDYLWHQVDEAYDAYIKLPEGTVCSKEFMIKDIDQYLN